MEGHADDEMVQLGNVLNKMIKMVMTVQMRLLAWVEDMLVLIMEHMIPLFGLPTVCPMNVKLTGKFGISHGFLVLLTFSLVGGKGGLI